MPNADSWRDGRTTAQRGYGAKRQAARRTYLQANPLCRMCERRGQYVPATVVDHIKPHAGDLSLFWSRSNWQPLCKACHDGAKQHQDRTGRVRGFDADGNPLDAGHHWNAAR